MSLKPDFESAYVQVGVLVKDFISPHEGAWTTSANPGLPFKKVSVQNMKPHVHSRVSMNNIAKNTLIYKGLTKLFYSFQMIADW